DDTASDDVLTLREAVLLVNNTGDASAALGRGLTVGEQGQSSGSFGSADTIQFAPGLNGQTIALTDADPAGELVVSKDVTVSGQGATSLTVSGIGQHCVFVISGGS